jgi:hypothetical protein
MEGKVWSKGGSEQTLGVLIFMGFTSVLADRLTTSVPSLGIVFQLLMLDASGVPGWVTELGLNSGPVRSCIRQYLKVVHRGVETHPKPVTANDCSPK